MRARLVATVAAMAMALIVPAVPAATPPAAQVLASCSWSAPGQNSYTGSHADALARYTDIAPELRARLLKRIAAHDYDDMVTITRDAIEGHHRYDPGITDMHFGRATLCRSVRRDEWTAAMQERGLVYCEGTACVMLPTVCRNMSRITRIPELAVIEPAEPLEFEPPSALAPPDEGEPELVVGEPAPESGPVPRPIALPLVPIWWGPPVAPPRPLPAIPEPPSASLLLLGVAMLALLRLRHTARPECGEHEQR